MAQERIVPCRKNDYPDGLRVLQVFRSSCSPEWRKLDMVDPFTTPVVDDSSVHFKNGSTL